MLDTRVIYRNDHSCCGPISMLKRLENGDIVLVFREALWRGVRSHGDPTTRTSLIRSTDGGETWHTQVTPDPSGGNGTSINQLSDGTLLVNSFHWDFAPMSRKHELQGRDGYHERNPLGIASANGGIWTAKSGDGGYTWAAPRRVDTTGYFGPSTAGRVVELQDGTLVMPLNGKRDQSGPGGVWIVRSTDGGNTWREPSDVAFVDGIDLHEMRILPIGDGRIVAGMRTPDLNVHTSRSDEGGHTWSAPAETPIWSGGSSPFDLLSLQDGRVLSTYGHRRPPYGVRACLSDDGGETWDIANEKVLRDDGLDRDMGYPSSEQLEDGSILTVYYWHQEDQIRHLVGTRWSVD